MKPLLTLGTVALGAVIALTYLPRTNRAHLGGVVRHRLMKRMEHLMASLPDTSPPKLVVSVLPRLQRQNDEIIALLHEQNELLRKSLRVV